ncbi:unnamed protein product, partial [Gongylonema pulchrum]|uniref:SANTA domain-containing protein n=1 Tax=Gongylonema pulchrum TaxID=637853 RepID=A0A183DZQ9_9BILA
MDAERSKETTTELKFWIFRFIRSDDDRCAVCVEGYRKKDSGERELENWRSTAIAERYNSLTLITVTGSKYILSGVIDQDSAYALGYPKTLIERFRDGFPYEWYELLQKYHSTVILPNTVSQHQYSSRLNNLFLDISRLSGGAGFRNSSIFGSVLGDLEVNVGKPALAVESGRKTAKHSVIAEKILEEDEFGKENTATTESAEKSGTTIDFSASFEASAATTSRNGFLAERNSSMNSDEPPDESAASRRTITTTPVQQKCLGRNQKQLSLQNFPDNDQAVFKMPLLPVQKHSKPVSLLSWTIRFSVNELGESKLFPNFAFVLIGYRPDKCMDWKTSCIIGVSGNRWVQTATTEYELVGPI